MLAVLAVVAACVLGTAAPAGAHATLIATDPVEGSVLETAPEELVFVFDEPVSDVPDGVQVFDAEGTPIESSATARGQELAVELPGSVGEGTLVVSWRVLSSDGHPITGSLTFSIGAPSETVAQPAAGEAGSLQAPWALSLVRFIGYVGLLLAAGLVAFTVLFLRAGVPVDRSRRRLVITARSAAALAVVAWLIALPLTASYQLGTGALLSSSGAIWAALPMTEYLVAAAVAAGVVLAVALLGSGRPSRTSGTWAVVAGGVALSAPALVGHTRAAAPKVLSIGADVLHLLAGSVWLGGLVGLALTLPELSGRRVAAGAVLARFSGVAAALLTALVATGSLLAWRIAGSWDDLVGSGYGAVLLIKIAVAGIAVGIAAWNRYRLLPRLLAAPRDRARALGGRLVNRSVAAEAAVLVGVVLVTGFLVDQSPEARASDTASATGEQADVQSATLGDVVVEAALAPQTTGSNVVTVELLSAQGGPAFGVESLQARMSSGQVDLGAIPLTFAAEGRYTAQVVLPSPGTWQLQVSVRRSEFVSPIAYLEFVVEGP